MLPSIILTECVMRSKNNKRCSQIEADNGGKLFFETQRRRCIFCCLIIWRHALDCFNEGIIREIMRLILDLPRILPPLIIYPLDVKQIIKALKIQQGKSKSFVFEMLTYVRVPSWQFSAISTIFVSSYLCPVQERYSIVRESGGILYTKGARAYCPLFVDQRINGYLMLWTINGQPLTFSSLLANNF